MATESIGGPQLNGRKWTKEDDERVVAREVVLAALNIKGNELVGLCKVDGAKSAGTQILVKVGLDSAKAIGNAILCIAEECDKSYFADIRGYSRIFADTMPFR